ncbi:MAG: transposase [Ginsengibacter sp.]
MLKSVPGIGPLTAASLLVEINRYIVFKHSLFLNLS